MPLRVYIDQGHNPSGYNTGAEGNGYYEQDITFDIGRRLYDLLESNPAFDAKLSRPTADTVLGFDNSSSLRERVADANRWDADLFISLHANASVNPDVSGSEALVYSPTSTVAVGVARDILNDLTLMTGLRNRGIVFRPGLYVLKKTKMPAVLVEMGFITNFYDTNLMVESPWLFATGIYRGITNYYSANE